MNKKYKEEHEEDESFEHHGTSSNVGQEAKAGGQRHDGVKTDFVMHYKERQSGGVVGSVSCAHRGRRLTAGGGQWPLVEKTWTSCGSEDLPACAGC